MKFRKREIVLLLLAAAMLFAVSSCSKKESSEAAAEPARDTIVVQIAADPSDLNPYTLNTNESSRVRNQILEPLLGQGYNMKMTPMLATGYEREDDTHYIFHLREGVKFHNGNDFTAEDVVFSLKTAASIKLSKKYVEFVDVENTVAVDDHTVRVALTKPDLFFLTSISGLQMVDKDAYEADPDLMSKQPVGTGPYELVDWKLGSEVVLKKFNDYWGEPAKIENVVFRPIGEPSQRAIELETGGIDVILDLQASDFTRFDGDPKFETYKRVGFRTQSLYYNNSDASIMKSKLLRQALSYVFDTNAIAKVGYNGFAKPSVTFFTEGFVNYDERFNKGVFYEQDIEKAKKLLAEAGYPDGFEVEFYISDSNLDVIVSEIMQNQLAQIGVKATISSYEGAIYRTILNDPNSGWDVALTNMQAPSGHSIDYFNAFLAEDGLNRPAYRSAEFNKLIKTALITTDEQKSLDLEDQILEILNEDVPFRPLVQVEMLYAWTSDLKNMDIWGQSNVHLSDVSF